MHGMSELKRRAFLGTLAAPAIAAIPGLQAQQRRSLHLVMMRASDRTIARSSDVGVAEVRRAAELLGVRFTCNIIPAGQRISSALLESADAFVLLSKAGRPFPGIISRPMITTTMLGPAAPANLFSVCASAAAKAKALARIRAEQATVTEWHASLFRYGAEQLNARMRAAGITPAAATWAAWFAVKVAAETVLRTPPDGSTTEAAASLAFDAHKGVAVTFGPDRYLRQPLYLVSADNTVIGTIAPEETGR